MIGKFFHEWEVRGFFGKVAGGVGSLMRMESVQWSSLSIFNKGKNGIYFSRKKEWLGKLFSPKEKTPPGPGREDYLSNAPGRGASLGGFFILFF